MVEVKVSQILDDADDKRKKPFYHLAEMIEIYYKDLSVINDYETVDYEAEFTVAEVETWICTDTLVGLFVVYYNGSPCAIRYKSGRKSPVRYYYFESVDAIMEKIFMGIIKKHKVEKFYSDESICLD